MDKEKWEKPLNGLTSEVVVLLQKFSEMINEDVRLRRVSDVETNQLHLPQHYIYSGGDGKAGSHRGSRIVKC